MTHNDRERMILLTRILKIHTEILIPSGSAVRLHLLGHMRRAVIGRNPHPAGHVSSHSAQMILDCAEGGGSLLKICGHLSDQLDHDPDLHQYRREPEYHPSDRNHPSLHQLWRVLTTLPHDRNRNPLEYLARVRGREEQPCPKSLFQEEQDALVIGTSFLFVIIGGLFRTGDIQPFPDTRIRTEPEQGSDPFP